jgi:DNA-binding CsgD family transcriptional regulator
MLRTIIIYALGLAAAAFALEWLDYKRFTRSFTVEIYVALIALGFLALGVWVGVQLTARRSGPFVRSANMTEALGVTDREMTVLELVAAGRSNKEIAQTLGVSPHTVKTHVAHLYEKLGVSRRTHAVDAARRLSLLP